MSSEVRCGDCLEVVRGLAGGWADLVYVDPPFFSPKDALAHDTRPDENLRVQRRMGVALGVHRVPASTNWLNSSAFSSLRIALFSLRHQRSHHIRCLLDEVLGPAMFRSEIIWHYRRWSNSQRSPLPSHQTIFFYSKTDDYQYFQCLENYSPSTNIDQILQRRERDEHGKAVYARDENGKVILDGHKGGVPVGDVWDIPFAESQSE